MKWLWSFLITSGIFAVLISIGLLTVWVNARYGGDLAFIVAYGIFCFIVVYIYTLLWPGWNKEDK